MDHPPSAAPVAAGGDPDLKALAVHRALAAAGAGAAVAVDADKIATLQLQQDVFGQPR